MLRPLNKANVKASTAILNLNQPGSTTHHLSWIWQQGSDAEGSSPAAIREFNRIHYIHARAQKMRWEEEVILVKYEMEWTARFFIYQSVLWKGRHQEANTAGVAAYAARKSAIWYSMAKIADASFATANEDYKGQCVE
ncbi:hypothetical protein AN958_11167 [Leucoagaricus sp. SymC.cos]|nr:hypothetical protein AN958_11167 [Leucoagaricus sp. SymC.cos]